MKCWTLEEIADSTVLELGTKGKLVFTILLLDPRSWSNRFPFSFFFPYGQNGNIAWSRSGGQKFFLTKLKLLGRAPQIFLALNDIGESRGGS